MSFLGRLASSAKSFCGISRLSCNLPSKIPVFNLTPILKAPILKAPMILSRGYCAPVYDVLEALHLKGPVIKNRFASLNSSL
jgi:hypothetical protein